MRFVLPLQRLEKATGPFIGPKGGKWADPQHTIPWTEGAKKKPAVDHGEAVRELGRKLAAEHGAKISITHYKGVTTVHGVAVPKEARGQGVGGKIMEAILQHADEHGHRVQLTADPTFAGNKGSKPRLVKWYKKLGFVENKGRHKDFTTTSGMYREPVRKALVKGGPYIGPKGGKWADAAHTIPWKEPEKKAPLFHAAPAHALESIQEHGLKPRAGGGLFSHGVYGTHSQGKVFLAEHPTAARHWHEKVENMLESQHDDPKMHRAVLLRVKPRATKVDEIGERDVEGSRYTTKPIPPEHIEYHDHKLGWRPISKWDEDARTSLPKTDEAALHPGTEKERERAKAKERAKAERARKKESAKRIIEAGKELRAKQDALNAEWAAKTPEERRAKAKELAEMKTIIPGFSMLTPQWREALGVDAKGELIKAGPYIGPKGGKWADPKHTIPWRESNPRTGVVEVDNRTVHKLASRFVDALPKNRAGVIPASSLEAPESMSVKLRDAGGTPREVSVRFEVSEGVKDPRGISGNAHSVLDPDTREIEHRVTIKVSKQAWDAEKLKAAVRDVVSHELAHQSDPGIHRGVERARAKLVVDPSKPPKPMTSRFITQGEAYRAYLNHPREVTASLQQISRELRDHAVVSELIEDAKGHAEDPDMPAPMRAESLLEMYSERFRNLKPHLNERSLKRIYRAAAAIREGILNGDIKPLKKASPPAGFTMAPHSKNNAYRKKVAGKWVYWYPDSERQTATPQWSERNFAEGKFDKEPSHWAWRTTQGRMLGWTQGGVDPHSKHPVKEAGVPHKLYQIIDAEADKGWARLRDVRTGETRVVQHERVYPVQWDMPKLTVKEPDKPVWDPEQAKPVGETKVGGEKLAVFSGSKAPAGTALHALENGAFSYREVRRMELDADGVPRKTKRVEPAIPDATKIKLLSEFEPLLKKAAKAAMKRHALKSTFQEGGGKPMNLTQADIQASAAEGLLRALQTYQGGSSFAAYLTPFVHGYANLEAARMRMGGVSLSARESRILPGFLAARAKAAHAFETDDPSPSQIASLWSVKRRDLHGGLDAAQGAREVSMGSYVLQGEKPTEKGAAREKSLRNYPGKTALAERFSGMLAGERAGASMESDTALLPGVGGEGLRTEQKIDAQRALKKLAGSMRERVLRTPRGEYKADAGDIAVRMLGLTGGDPESVRAVADAVPIYKRKGDKWERLGSTQARAQVEAFLADALDDLREQLGDKNDDAARVLATATRGLFPEVRAARGPTFTQILQARAKRVTPEQVTQWRREERNKLRRVRERIQHDLSRTASGGAEHTHHAMLLREVEDALQRVNTISRRKVAMRIAAQLAPETKAMRELQTKFVEIDPRKEGSVAVTDVHGSTQLLRVRKVGELEPWNQPLGSFAKSLAGVTDGMLAEHLQRPELSRLLYGSDDPLAAAPTQSRDLLDELVGLS